ncbi:fibronectin type III domain-containing protein, partial [Acerihabitans arboris]
MSNMNYQDPGLAETRPHSPINLQAYNILYTSVSLHWELANDGEVNPTAYSIYQDGRQIIGQNYIGGTIEGLTPATTYQFYVTASWYGTDSLNPSNTITVTTLGTTLRPSSPVNLRATAIAATSVTLQWDTGTDGSLPVARYRIFQNGSEVNSTAANGITITGLSPATQYSFYIWSEAANGQLGAYASNTITPTTAALPLPRPPSPVNLRATAITPTSISLQWDTGTDGTAPVSRYWIYQNGGLADITAANSITIANLTPGTTYRFYIVSEGLDGQFGLNASNEITPTTAALARPPSP